MSVMHGTVIIDTEGHFHGILAVPQVSKNDKFYFPSELASADGETLAIYDQHGDMFELGDDGRPIMMPDGNPMPRHSPPPPPDGQLNAHWDESTYQLKFDGFITNPKLQKMIDSGERKFVSLRADPTWYQMVGDGVRTYAAPRGLKGHWISAATTDTPGIRAARIGAEMYVCEMQLTTGPPYAPKIREHGVGSAEPDIDDPNVIPKGLKDVKVDPNVIPAGLKDTKSEPNSIPAGLSAEPDADDESAISEIDSVNYSIGEPQGQYKPPKSGTLPKSGKKILAAVYRSCRNDNPGEDPAKKQKCASIAWAAVKNAGYSQSGDKWSKSESVTVSGVTSTDTVSSRTVAAEQSKAESSGVKTLTAEQDEDKQKKKQDTTQTENERIKEINNTQTSGAGGVGGATRKEVSGPLTRNQAGGPQADISDEDLARMLAEVLTKRPELIERILAKHPSLITLEKLASELRLQPSAKAAGSNVHNGILSPIEGWLWEDMTRISAKVREAKKANPSMWGVEVGILHPPDAFEQDERKSYYNALRRVASSLNGARPIPQAYEASLTSTTSGAALGVDSITPVVVIPTQYPAQLRDTTLFKTISQGADRARFQLINAYAAGALGSEATSTTEATDTLTQVDVLTTSRGIEKRISFEAQRKVIGPIDEGVLLAMRLGELYDEDTIIYGGLGVSGISGLEDITTGNLANIQYGDASVSSEPAITSTMTFKEQYIRDFVKFITNKGYTPDGLVCVLSPKQFDDLLGDSNIVRYLQYFGSGNWYDALIAQGFIPQLHGVEIRRSTLVPTGTGCGAITTFHAYCYKKQFSIAMGASQDVMIESFRDIDKNATLYKAHYMLGTNIIKANSIARTDTA